MQVYLKEYSFLKVIGTRFFLYLIHDSICKYKKIFPHKKMQCIYQSIKKNRISSFLTGLMD